MPIRLKILVACLLLTVVTVSLGIFTLRNERRLGDLAVRFYDEALMSVSFVRSAATRFETVRSRYAMAGRDEREHGPGSPFDPAAARQGFDDVLDGLDVTIERAPSGRARAAAVALRTSIAAMRQQADDVDAIAARLEPAAAAFDQAVEMFAQDGYDYRERAEDLMRSSVRSTWIAIGVSALVALVITLLLSRAIVPQLGRATRAALAIADGRLDNVLPSGPRGWSETSILLGALARMQTSIRGNAARIEAMHAAEEALRAEAAAVQAMVVTSLGNGLERLAAGDLTVRLEHGFAVQYEQLRTNFNGAIDQLQRMVRGIVANTAGLHAGIDEIAVGADHLSRRSEQQAASLEEIAAALDEITTTVRKTANGAKHARDIVLQTTADAEHSGDIVRQAASAMGTIEQSSHQINEIVGVIDEIAIQTNLLALNASVEAARAGDSGRGFAVVASEVRALSQRSAEAAKEIRVLLSTATRQVGTGVKLVRETGQALGRIVEGVAQINTVVSEIAVSAREQAAALHSVNAATNQMDKFTQQNAAMVDQSTTASHALAQETADLVRLTERFQIAVANDPVDTPIRRARAEQTAAPGATPVTAAEAWQEFAPLAGPPASL
jgi:methyl-accepting chemotaxis protein